MTNDLSPVSIDAIIPQGSDVYELLTIYTDEAQTVPLDLNGFTATYQVRKTFDSATPVLDLSTDNGTIILGATDTGTSIIQTDLTNGVIAIKYAAATTSAILFKGDTLECVRSLELTDATLVTRRVLDGALTFTREADR
jgi:hypothetical protein